MNLTVECYKPGCYATICLSPKSYENLKRTGESFYCPAGHQQHFPGKTDEQKQIDRLTRDLRDTGNELNFVHGHRETLIDVVRHCPICGATPGRLIRVYRDWRFEDGLAMVREWLAEHLRERHGAAIETEARSS